MIVFVCIPYVNRHAESGVDDKIHFNGIAGDNKAVVSSSVAIPTSGSCEKIDPALFTPEKETVVMKNCFTDSPFKGINQDDK